MAFFTRALDYIYEETDAVDPVFNANPSHGHDMNKVIDAWLVNDQYAPLGLELAPFRFDNPFEDIPMIEVYQAERTVSAMPDGFHEESCVNLVGGNFKHDGPAKGQEVRSPFGVVLAPCAICGQRQKNESEARYAGLLSG